MIIKFVKENQRKVYPKFDTDSIRRSNNSDDSAFVVVVVVVVIFQRTSKSNNNHRGFDATIILVLYLTHTHSLSLLFLQNTYTHYQSHTLSQSLTQLHTNKRYRQKRSTKTESQFVG